MFEDEKSISLDGDYIRYDVTETDNYKNNGDSISIYQYDNDLNRQIDAFVSRFDVDLPFESFKFATGLSFTHSRTVNAADFRNRIGIPDQNDHFDYRENIYGMYADLMFRPLPSMMAKIGVRGEYDDVLGTPKDNEQIKKNKFHIFPSVFVNYRLGNDHFFNLSFTKRINRPSFEYMNPFMHNIDKFSAVAGNPMLKPSMNYDASLRYVFKRNLNVSIYYSFEDDIALQFPEFDTITSVTISKWDNILKVHSLMLQAGYRLSPAPWIDAKLSASGYTLTSESKKTGQNENALACLVYLGSNIYFNKNKTLYSTLDMQYASPEIYANRRTLGRFYLNLGIRYSLFNNRLEMGLKCQNLLKNVTGRVQEFDNGLSMRTENKVLRKIFFTLNYNFGGNIRVNAHDPVDQTINNRL